MIFAADPALNLTIGLAGTALCLLNYRLLGFRPAGGRTWLFLLLNHVALAAMLTGALVSAGAGLAAVAGLWAALALLAVPASRARKERDRIVRRLRPGTTFA